MVHPSRYLSVDYTMYSLNSRSSTTMGVNEFGNEVEIHEEMENLLQGILPEVLAEFVATNNIPTASTPSSIQGTRCLGEKSNATCLWACNAKCNFWASNTFSNATCL
jgi:hypothetical protein